MALKRVTKSIPLSGGITEGADDLLLEPPGMQYVENIQFTSKDAGQKYPPTTLLSATGGANYTDKAYGLYARGSNVAVIENDKVLLSNDSGSSFTSYSQDTNLGGIEREIGVEGIQGAQHFSWVPLGAYLSGDLVVTGYAVVIDSVQLSSVGSDGSRATTLRIYDTKGNILDETVLDLRFAAIVPSGVGEAVCFLVDGLGDLHIYKTGSNAWSFVAEETGYAIYNLRSQHLGSGTSWGSLSWEDARIGWTSELRSQVGMVAHQPIDGLFGVHAWKDSITHELKWRAHTSAGVYGSETVISTDSGNVKLAALACFLRGDYIYVLFSQTDVSIADGANCCDLVLYRNTWAAPGAGTSYTFKSNEDGVIVNGSIYPLSTSIYVAYTVMEGSPVVKMDDTVGGDGVRYFGIIDPFNDIAARSIDVNVALYSQRLISNIELDDNNDPYFVVQQFGNFNNLTVNIAGLDNPQQATILPVQKKPMTSILVRAAKILEPTGVFDPVFRVCGTFDAAQSKAKDAGEEEQSIQLGNLYFLDGTLTDDLVHNFYFANRTLLVAQDTWSFLDKTTGGSTNNSNNVLSAGVAGCNIYRISPNIRVPYEQFSEGLILGTSAPTWYAGGTVLETAGILESPEIVGAYADNDQLLAIAYQNLTRADPADAPKVYQAVVSYVDNKGNLHRSAPSQPVYLFNVLASGSVNANTVYIYVSPPLGLSTKTKFFVEIYASLPGETPQLARVKEVRYRSGSSVVQVRVPSVLSPHTFGEIDVETYRSSKALYTAGGELAADPWPNFDMVVKSGRRLFAHAINNPSTIYYSKLFTDGVAPEFSASLAVTIANEEITAIGTMDDKVIVFTPTDTWYLYGPGPDNTGAQGDFSVERMPHGIGCTDPESVVSYRDGVAFFSNSTDSFHVVTRDLQILEIGDNVSGMTAASGFSVDRVLHNPSNTEILWYCATGSQDEYVADSAVNTPTQPPRPFLANQPPSSAIFVYNYGEAKWSVVEQDAEDLQLVGTNGTTLYEVRDWDLLKRDAGVTNWSTSGLCKWETPWLRVAQMQNFGRFVGATLLGKYLSSWALQGGSVQSGDLQVTVHYDYEGAGAETSVHRWRANQDFDPADGNRFQLFIHPSRQKCQAIKFVIEEIATEKVELSEPAYTRGQGFVLLALDLEYALKAGTGQKSLGKSRFK